MQEILLTIELVPASSWFANVRSHVAPATWDILRKDAYRAAQYRCEICGGTGPKWPVECHQIWVYSEKRKIQRLDGLQALCPDCHEVKHFGLAQIRDRGEEAFSHLVTVNGWSKTQGWQYLGKVFDTYERRSRVRWTLDLNWLRTSYGLVVPVRSGPAPWGREDRKRR